MDHSSCKPASSLSPRLQNNSRYLTLPCSTTQLRLLFIIDLTIQRDSEHCAIDGCTNIRQSPGTVFLIETAVNVDLLPRHNTLLGDDAFLPHYIPGCFGLILWSLPRYLPMMTIGGWAYVGRREGIIPNSLINTTIEYGDELSL